MPTVGEFIAIGISVGSLIIAILAYRHANKVKKLDLLVEAGRARNNLHSNFVTLVELHPEAMKSRKAVASATGKSQGGAMHKWQAEWEGDEAFIKDQITPNVPKKDTDYKSLSPERLVSAIVDLHHLDNRVKELLDKYRSWMADDDNERDHIREDMRTKYPRGNKSGR